MKKYSGVLFIFCLLLFLFILVFIYKIDGKYIFDYKINFLSLDDFILKKEQPKVIEVKITPVFKNDTVHFSFYNTKSDDALDSYVDSLVAYSKLEIKESDYKASPFLINHPINGVYPLDAFFDQLSSLDSIHFLSRVAHYGDSQIEGDRMTNTFRKLFQGKFRGDGVGYLPIADITAPVTYSRSSSSAWTRHSIFKNKLKGYAYGIGGSTFRYSPFQEASVSLKLKSAYQKVFLLYGLGNDSSTVEVYNAVNTLVASSKLNSKSVFNFVELNLSSNESNLKFIFKGPSPCIYGICIDPVSGIQFDNYGIRGQSGNGLMLISKEQLGQMFEQTNTHMAILQFGGNIVAGLQSEKSIQYYAEAYKKLYLHFKNSLANGSIFIFGVNDVSRSVNGEYRSYPNITELRYLQRKIAVENGMAFFDIYQLMGGENSIKVWARKGLAARDGHYSEKGREIVCREIYKALIFEYNKYLKRKSSRS